MKRPLMWGCICLIAVVAVWTCIYDAPPFADKVPLEEGAQVTVTGQIYQKEYRSYYGTEITNLYLKSIQIVESDTGRVSELNPKYQIICETERAIREPELGRSIKVSGSWSYFEYSLNPGEFDSADYYASQNIVGKLKKGNIQAQNDRYWHLREWLYCLRVKLQQRLYQALPEKEAGILSKMLLGVSSGMDQEIRELYQRNGIVHILSISGLHITIIGTGIYKLLRRCTVPILPAAAAGVIILLLYGAMTGFGVSSVRAIGMYIIRLLGDVTGRSYDSLTALGILMALMVCRNPRLLYHSGFLLSFSSVCGVGCLYPIINLQGSGRLRSDTGRGPDVIGIVRKRFSGLWQSLWASASITLFTLPVTLWFFYEVPVYSPFVNLMILPFMSIVMGAGGLLMLLPHITPLAYLEQDIFWICDKICLLSEALPGHTWVAGKPKVWQIAVYYLLVLLIIWLSRQYQSNWWALGLAVPVLLLGLKWPGGDQVAVLAVGQGDAIAVIARTGEAYLFDGGSSTEKTVGKDIIVPYLKSQGVDCLDGIFISHPDSDHVSGIMEILEQDLMEVKALYLPEVDESCREDFGELLGAVSDQRVIYYSQGDQLQQGELTISCMHPPAGYSGESNVYSGCFLVRNAEFSVLLTGDVEGAGEQALIESLNRQHIRKVHVLKTAHHGSKYSGSATFLKQIRPEVAVISCGENNSYGHPHEETLERLSSEEIPYVITYEKGCVTITGKGYKTHIGRR